MDNFQPNLQTARLIEKYLRNDLSAAEEKELELWIGADPQNLELFNKLMNNALDEQMLNFYAENEPAYEQNAGKKPALRWWRPLYWLKHKFKGKQ